MSNKEIICSERKINAVINNAKKFIAIRNEFGTLDKYIWSFTNNKTLVYPEHSAGNISAKNELSDKVSLDLKKRGLNL